MSRKIYKYPLNGNGQIQIIKAPIIKTLSVCWQESIESAVMYNEVDEELEDIALAVVGIGTGWEIGDTIEDWVFIGTVIDQEMDLVWHYYAVQVPLEDLGKKDTMINLYKSLVGIEGEVVWM